MSAVQKDTNLSAGWTIDTASYKYDMPRPDEPTITKIVNDADASLAASGSVYTTKPEPVISGECTPSKDDKHPNGLFCMTRIPSIRLRTAKARR